MDDVDHEKIENRAEIKELPVVSMCLKDGLWIRVTRLSGKNPNPSAESVEY